MTIKNRKFPSHIPTKVPFEGDSGDSKFKEYEVVGFKVPMKGEFFLSGAIVKAYKASNDLTTPYWVVNPK